MVEISQIGFNGTILAYGQTASGKTYTMEGTDDSRGIIPRVVDMVFAAIDESPESIEFELKVSIMEIYMEEIKDLLDISNKNLKIRSERPGGVTYYSTRLMLKT
jgi:kinesin family protein 5